MKKTFLILAVVIGLLLGGCQVANWLKHGDCGCAHAEEVIANNLTVINSATEEDGFTLTVKQASLYVPKDSAVKQFTAFEVVRTDVDQVPNWPKWGKALYAGWSLDAGFAYDDSDVLKDGALCLSREFGTLQDYLPLKFPLFNKITISVHVAGAVFEDLFTSPKKPKYCAGLSYIKGTIKLW